MRSMIQTSLPFAFDPTNAYLHGHVYTQGDCITVANFMSLLQRFVLCMGPSLGLIFLNASVEKEMAFYYSCKNHLRTKGGPNNFCKLVHILEYRQASMVIPHSLRRRRRRRRKKKKKTIFMMQFCFDFGSWLLISLGFLYFCVH